MLLGCSADVMKEHADLSPTVKSSLSTPSERKPLFWFTLAAWAEGNSKDNRAKLELPTPIFHKKPIHGSLAYQLACTRLATANLRHSSNTTASDPRPPQQHATATTTTTRSMC
jgi:hypothetical protein